MSTLGKKGRGEKSSKDHGKDRDRNPGNRMQSARSDLHVGIVIAAPGSLAYSITINRTARRRGILSKTHPQDLLVVYAVRATARRLERRRRSITMVRGRPRRPRVGRAGAVRPTPGGGRRRGDAAGLEAQEVGRADRDALPDAVRAAEVRRRRREALRAEICQ